MRSRLFHTECFVRGQEEEGFAVSCYHLTAALDLGTFCLKWLLGRELDPTGAELYRREHGSQLHPSNLPKPGSSSRLQRRQKASETDEHRMGWVFVHKTEISH